MFKVGVTGGIGSGKSTVCRLFAARGVAVYDTDAAAKELMNTSEELKQALTARFGEATYLDGALNRAYLAERVFGNESELQALNGLVHPAVIADFERWAEEQTGEYVVLESAILYEAGLDKHLDAVVAVLAPEQLRLERAMRRDGASEEQIRSRMAAQMSDEELHRRADVSVVNIFEEDLEPMVQELDFRFKHHGN
ncbi:MAG: dephospho-CoA kinase [Alistipes sp.]|nr:dephospho-CoA kinase [Alistipes sp.]